MLKQASVSDLITDRVHRGRGSYVVIAMGRYPRFIKRELRDEYLADLGTSRILLQALLTIKRRTGDHNGAFAKAGFERHFALDEAGWADLERLSRLSKQKDVYLVCQCARGLRCHRELLLLLAAKRFGATIDSVSHDYPEFERRIAELKPRAARARTRASARRTSARPRARRRAA